MQAPKLKFSYSIWPEAQFDQRRRQRRAVFKCNLMNLNWNIFSVDFLTSSIVAFARQCECAKWCSPPTVVSSPHFNIIVLLQVSVLLLFYCLIMWLHQMAQPGRRTKASTGKLCANWLLKAIFTIELILNFLWLDFSKHSRAERERICMRNENTLIIGSEARQQQHRWN